MYSITIDPLRRILTVLSVLGPYYLMLLEWFGDAKVAQLFMSP